MDIQEVKNLKYNRLKPEEKIMLDILYGLIGEEVTLGLLVYKNNDYPYLSYNTKTCYLKYDFDRIHIPISNIGYTYAEITIIVQNMVEKYLHLTNKIKWISYSSIVDY